VAPPARARRALAALALALAAPAAHCLELGTLFTTPEERARLDRLRRGEPDAAGLPVRIGAPRLTGFVRRSDGRNTVWIDGAPVPMASPESARLLDPRAVRDRSQRSEEALKIESKPER
jgi:hypothetical protein